MFPLKPLRWCHNGSPVGFSKIAGAGKSARAKLKMAYISRRHTAPFPHYTEGRRTALATSSYTHEAHQVLAARNPRDQFDVVIAERLHAAGLINHQGMVHDPDRLLEVAQDRLREHNRTVHQREPA